MLAFGLTAAPHVDAQEPVSGFNAVTMNVAMVPLPGIFWTESNWAGCPINWLGVADWDCLANKISTQILEANYDIVILNEVFADSPKWVFSKRLSSRFPHRVEYLKDAGTSGPTYIFAPDQDSGLMLFTRFQPIASQNGGAGCNVSSFELKGTGWGTTSSVWGNVNFRGFGNESVGDDRKAAKGVGYLRMRGPSSRIFNVFFTHLQASYGDTAYCDDYWCDNGYSLEADKRENQLDLIQDFANCHTDPVQHDEEVFILAGDLNVNGDTSNPWDDITVELGKDRRHSRWQWDDLFNPLSTHPKRVTLGGTGVATARDLWAFAMQPTACLPAYKGVPATECQATPFPPGFTGPASFDRGFTFAGGDGKDAHEERYDYFVMGTRSNTNPQVDAPPTEHCAQHLTAAWNLFAPDPDNPNFGFEMGMFGVTGRPSQTSDHFGVNLEVERSWKYCNPTFAFVNPPDGTSQELKWERSVQWYKLPTPGTYTFNVNPKNHNPPGTDNGLDFRVFAPTDLSLPLPPPYGEAQEVPAGPDIPGYTDIKYNVPTAPFYVKVFKSTPNADTVPYSFRWHRNTCNTEDEACDRFPFEGIEGQDPLEHFPFTDGYLARADARNRSGAVRPAPRPRAAPLDPQRASTALRAARRDFGDLRVLFA